MEKIFFDTFVESKLSKKRREKKDTPEKSQRHIKKEIGIECNKIMALTTAGGSGKYPLLYVEGYPAPLELPDMNFDTAQAQIEEFAKRKEFNMDYLAGNVFLRIGNEDRRFKVLVNKRWVKTARETTGEIVLSDGQILKGLTDEDIRQYINAAEEEDKKFRKIADLTRKILLSAPKKEFENRLKKVKEEFQPIDDAMSLNGCLSIISIILNLVLTILVIILLFRL